MVIHAARHHGVEAVGVTLSREQAELATRRVAEAGLADRVEIRCADYRDVRDGPFDAISSIGMFEHVGASHLGEYFSTMHGLLRPQGRLLNHGISRASGSQPMRRSGFIQRYVFPDGELVEVASVAQQIQRAGMEVRHVENLREHYALTLREWVRRIEDNYAEAVRLVGEGRARVWRLYLAGSALAFEAAEIELHQTLAVRLADGASGMALRPDWELSGLGSAAPVRPAGRATGADVHESSGD
jgi:cyclopropane-fatty-acyl-phospholipid synthase